MDIEVVKLVVSETTGTPIGKRIGLGREGILALRQGQPSGDARNDALAKSTASLRFLVQASRSVRQPHCKSNNTDQRTRAHDTESGSTANITCSVSASPASIHISAVEPYVHRFTPGVSFNLC